MDYMNESMTIGSDLTLINDAKSSVNLPLLELGKAICKITWETPFGMTYGSGFLCEFKCSDTTVKGLFTCSHVINCLERFLIEFERNRFSCNIKTNHVKWMFTDREIDFTFIAFSDDFIINENALLQVDISSEPEKNQHVTILQHPKGNKLSVAEGKILSRDGYHISYTSSTLGGSSGGAILNEKSQVIAIHKRGGPITDLSLGQKFASHNIGVLISEVIQTLSKAKPWDASQWKVSEHESRKLSVTNPLSSISDEKQRFAVNSLCQLSMKNKEGIHYSNGFLCDVTLKNDVTINGLFTNKHVLLSKPDPFFPFSLHFFNDNSKFELQSSDLLWVHADDKLHFTFMAFDKTFADKIKNENRKFLTLAKASPGNGSKFVVIQHVKSSEPMIFEGVLNEGFNGALCHQGNGQPHIHGSLILNENSEVIGIGNTCGWSQQIGTLVTQDIVLRVLKGAYENEKYCECTRIDEVTDMDLSKSGAALCRIKTKAATFTGFLGVVPYGSNKLFKGLFTNYHGISHKQQFEVHINKRCDNLKVEPSNIQYWFHDKALEFTFLVFTNDFLAKLTKEGIQFLSLTDQIPSDSLPIFLLHHPEGNAASLSRGVLKADDDNDLHYIAYTRFGSAGAPILNDNQEVIGIHKGTGPFDETGQDLYKIGTKMVDVKKSVNKMRMHVTV